MKRIFHKRRKPIVETIGQGLLFLSIIAAILYGGNWYPSGNILFTVIIKGCAVGFLALFVLISAQSFNHIILFLALCVAVTGDVLLALPGEHSFMRGLAAFLIAQILFTLLFLKNRLPREEITFFRLQIGSMLWAAAGIAAFFLYPHLNDLLVPVFVYTSALIIMATTALFSKFPVRLVAFGALLFVVSDSILGAEKFLTVPDYSGYIIWATYYLGVLLMTLGTMLANNRPTHFGRYRFD